MVTLIAATRNRPSELKRLLQSVTGQTYVAIQVIVVDQSERGTAELVQRLCKMFGAEYVRDEGVGLSRARNIGLRLVTGDIVGFPDDDCFYPADLVSRVVRWFEKHPEFSCLNVPYSNTGRVDTRRFPVGSVELNLSNFWLRHSSVGLFLRRQVVTHIGGFDEAFGVGGAFGVGEETDLLIRLLMAGFRAYYDSEIVVYHNVISPSARSPAMDLRYARGTGALLGKHVRNHLPFFGTLVRRLTGCLLKRRLAFLKALALLKGFGEAVVLYGAGKQLASGGSR